MDSVAAMESAPTLSRDPSPEMAAHRGSYHSISASSEPEECKETEQNRPNHTASLHQSPLRRAISLTPYIASMLVPISFLVLAVFIWRLRDQRTSNLGEKVMQAATIASTLWPIAFAAVLGPTLSTLALYRAERGVTLQVLELLSSSNTIVCTIKACINLRYASLWTIVLLVLWALSPAGGQAVLRSLSIEQPISHSSYAIAYFPAEEVGIAFNDVTWGSQSSTGSRGGVIRSMFGATIYSPNAAALLANGSSPDFLGGIERLGGAAKVIVASTTDVWGNVRMPYLELLPQYNPETPHDWVDVPTDEVPAYESLAGIPVRGLPLRYVGNITFPISAVYSTLKCSQWSNTTAWVLEHPHALNFHPTANESIWDFLKPPSIFNGISEIFMNVNHFADLPNLVFGTRYSVTGSLTTCLINKTHIDAEVECVRALIDREMSCSARRARHSKGLPITTAGEELTQKLWMASSVMKSIPYLSPATHSATFSPLEAYLADPIKPPSTFSTHDGINDGYANLPPGVFEARLAVIINTVFRISFNSVIMQGNDGIDPSNRTGRLMPGNMSHFGGDLYDNRTGLFGNTTGQWSAYSPPIYHIHKRWLILYVASIGVLILCVLGTIILRARICAPDFLGSVSAITRDSPYFDNPPGGSTMDGTQLARAIKEKRVRIGDVNPDGEVGKIAFAEEVFGPQALGRESRLYM